MADHYIIDLEEQNEILKKAVQNIAKECDNTNETHETIWRIAYNALQECGLDMVDAGENTLPIQRVSGMFSAADVEKSYKDGVNDEITKGYGTFDIENYR